MRANFIIESPGPPHSGYPARAGRLRAPTAWLLIVVAASLTGSAYADAVKIDRFWFDQMTIQEITAGHLVYVTSGGIERATPLDQIHGILVDGVAGLAEAERLYEAQQFAAAADAFAQIKARQPWQRHWIWARIVSATDHADKPTEAVEAYLQLLQSNADPYFLSQPPEQSLIGLDAQKRQGLTRRVTSARQRLEAEHPAIEPLGQMLGALGGKVRKIVPPPDQTPDNTPRVVNPTASAPTLPQAMPEDDSIAKLLRGHQFALAVKQADRTLRRPGQLPMKLYQRGIARLYLAEQSGSAADYKDAGLDFMRVVIYFPNNQTYMGPSLMEAGYVHARIGRPDKVRQLYERAELMIDGDQDPQLAARLTSLLTALGEQDE